jgi:hypothetical protein
MEQETWEGNYSLWIIWYLKQGPCTHNYENEAFSRGTYFPAQVKPEVVQGQGSPYPYKALTLLFLL